VSEDATDDRGGTGAGAGSDAKSIASCICLFSAPASACGWMGAVN